MKRVSASPRSGGVCVWPWTRGGWTAGGADKDGVEADESGAAAGGEGGDREKCADGGAVKA